MPAAPSFPAPGVELGGFRLLAEIGRGALGRVFVATQTALAGRPVVLKLSPRTGQEHLSLARLEEMTGLELDPVVERTTRSARVPLDPLFELSTGFRQAVESVGRGPGGPPHKKQEPPK